MLRNLRLFDGSGRLASRPDKSGRAMWPCASGCCATRVLFAIGGSVEFACPRTGSPRLADSETMPPTSVGGAIQPSPTSAEQVTATPYHGHRHSKSATEEEVRSGDLSLPTISPPQAEGRVPRRLPAYDGAAVCAPGAKVAPNNPAMGDETSSYSRSYAAGRAVQASPTNAEPAPMLRSFGPPDRQRQVSAGVLCEDVWALTIFAIGGCPVPYGGARGSIEELRQR